jgi:hypothetical protein
MDANVGLGVPCASSMAKDRTVQDEPGPFSRVSKFDEPAQLRTYVNMWTRQPFDHESSDLGWLEMNFVLYRHALRVTLRHRLVLLYRFDRAGTR